MKRAWFLYLIFILISFKVSAQSPIIFKGENIIVGKSLSLLKDEKHQYDINSVKKAKDFQISSSETPGLELSKADFWLKFSVKNSSQSNRFLLVLENSSLDECELFYPIQGKYFSKFIDNNKPFYKRKYKNQNCVFEVYLPRDSTAQYFIRVNSSEQMLLPVIIGTQQDISDYLAGHDIFWGLLIGLLSVMVLYNFFLYVSTKDKGYLYYVLYTAFTLLTQITLSGYTFKYLLSNNPFLVNKALVIFPGLAGIFGIIFIQSFLHSRDKTPKLNKLFIFCLVVYTAAILCRLFGLDLISYRLIDIAAISSILIIYTIAIIIAIQGYRPAKFFLLAWSVFFIGLVLFILRNLGILPYNFYTSYTMQVGTAVEVTLLSLALADRINILKREKEASQAEALGIAKENERIIKEQNVLLEQKVKERTVELIATNDELSDTLEDLKQAQSQLVAAEKMASLGQLTAGIAHEINNPINFVSSNVTPLSRDVNMLLDTIKAIEDIALSDLSIEEKQKQIEEFKEDLDFDYLQIEISHLLKGISEGASRTAEIVKGLRIFSRVDEDDLKRADINEGVDSTLIIVNNIIGKIEIVKDFGSLPLVECYPGKLNQVFLNIISNAIYAIQQKFKEQEGGQLLIKTYHENEKVCIAISDNGTGMDEQTLLKIFDPFFTTKEVGEGTGLGMSIAYNTIKKHQGALKVQSVLGEGTTFTIEIPILHNINNLNP